MNTTTQPCLLYLPNRLNVRMNHHRTLDTLNRISTIRNHHHYRQIRISYTKSMAEDSAKTNKTTTELPETKNKAPPAPEKPLPGDCCGSGCVRCVWDVYYDELEDYNKALRVVSKQDGTSKAS